MGKGRKRIEIDKKQFEDLCAFQCTLPEISAWFRVSEDTIERWVKREYKAKFAEINRQKGSIGKLSLRRKMFQTALEGNNVTMMIFLSKNYLDMRDAPKEDAPPPAAGDTFIFQSGWSKPDATEG